MIFSFPPDYFHQTRPNPKASRVTWTSYLNVLLYKASSCASFVSPYAIFHTGNIFLFMLLSARILNLNSQPQSVNWRLGFVKVLWRESSILWRVASSKHRWHCPSYLMVETQGNCECAFVSSKLSSCPIDNWWVARVVKVSDETKDLGKTKL